MRANEDESVPLCNSKRALLLAEHVELHVGSDAPLRWSSDPDMSWHVVTNKPVRPLLIRRIVIAAPV
jgi:hypothetical protein